MARITHLTSVHRRDDTRILQKMCRSLVAAKHDVALVVADGHGDAITDGVRIIDTGQPGSRVGRMMNATGRVVQAALATNADILHFHDSELLIKVKDLKDFSGKIVFDAHEDLPKQILSKHYLPKGTRNIVSKLSEVLEKRFARHVDHVFAATDVIQQNFVRRGIEATTIRNYPILDCAQAGENVEGRKRIPAVCYVGSLTRVRGVAEMASAMRHVAEPTWLNLAGPFQEGGLEEALHQIIPEHRLNYVGSISREKVLDLLKESRAGLCTLHSTPAHVDSLPVKMFEYMGAGLPVIASDFPLWREIIEDADCGILVDPEDPKAIAAAINAIIDNPARAEAMGRNGQRAVHERYNWANEFATLEAAYDEILRT